MKIIFSGGGTAGHINPALAVAKYLKDKEPSAQILYVGCKNSMEERLVKKAGIEFKGIMISGFSRKINLSSLKKNLLTLKRIFTASKEAKQIIADFKPDIVMGTGGYVSGPVLRTAAKMGIPTVIHEQNAYPGVSNKMLSKYAKCIMLAVEDAKGYFNKECNIKVTGNPIREEIINMNRETAKQMLCLDNRPVILSFGGSLGARKINEAIIQLIKWSTKDDRYQHIHAYGQYGEWFKESLKNDGIALSEHPNLDIRKYIDDMEVCLAAADVVICRAGAITISEIQAKGKAAILIPSPNVAENHQYHNAMALVKKEAADIIEEKDLNSKILIKKVNKIVRTPVSLKKYQENAQKMAIVNANERIYKIIKEILRKDKLKAL